MKTPYFKILFFLCCTHLLQSQCSLQISSSTIGGCAPLEVIFNVASVQSGGTFIWTAGTYTATGVTPSFTFAYPGTYIVSVSATLAAPGNTTCITTATLPNPISVFTGPANGCLTTITGLEENFDIVHIRIYPNPVRENFIVESTTEIENSQLILYNILGEKVREETLKPGSNVFHFPGLQNGIYSLCIFSNEKCLARKKLVFE